MEKLNKVKNNIKTHIPQTIGVVAVLAVSIVIMILCIGGCDSGDKEAVSTEKSASEGITTDKLTLEQKTTADEKDTTEESAETTTDIETGDETTDEEMTDKEVTTGNQQVMHNTTTAGQTTIGSHQVVQNTTTVKQTSSTGQTTTQRQTTAQRQTTTKKQEMTTPQQTTTAAPRGKNGVILEELSINFNTGVVPVPRTKFELSGDNPDDNGYVLLYLRVKPGATYGFVSTAIFQNEVKLYDVTRKAGSTEADIKAIYGEPMYQYKYNDGSNCFVYKYLNYTNEKKQIIYIKFVFWNNLGMYLGGIDIGNIDDMNDGYFQP